MDFSSEAEVEQPLFLATLFSHSYYITLLKHYVKTNNLSNPVIYIIVTYETVCDNTSLWRHYWALKSSRQTNLANLSKLTNFYSP